MEERLGGSVMEVNPESRKAYSSMDVKLDGSVMEVSELQD